MQKVLSGEHPQRRAGSRGTPRQVQRGCVHREGEVFLERPRERALPPSASAAMAPIKCAFFRLLREPLPKFHTHTHTHKKVLGWEKRTSMRK